MTTKTTTHLHLRARDYWMIHETRIRDAISLACIAGILVLVLPLLRPTPAPPLAPVVMRQEQKPIIIVQTSTALPSPTPAPTATAIVVVQYIEAPTPEPQVVYVEAAPQVVYVEAPTPEPVSAPAPTLSLPQAAILDRQQWAERAAAGR